MKHITGFGWYWLIWMIAGFGIPEVYGLIKNAKDTLSWQFWGLEHVNFKHPLDMADWTPLHIIMAVILLAFVVWLGAHIILGVWR